MRPSLRVVPTAPPPLEPAQTRLLHCDACGGFALATRTGYGPWTLRHECRPRDAMRAEVLAAALCFGGCLLVLAIQIVRGWWS